MEHGTGQRRDVIGEQITGMVVTALRRIIRSSDIHSYFLVSNYGLTGPQLTVLRELSRTEGMSVGELTRAIHLSQATVTGILDRLEKRQMVRRQRSDRDKRRVLLELTPRAQEILSLAPPPLQENFTSEFSKLADWEQTQILSSLQRVVGMLEAKHLDATPILETGPIDASMAETKAFLGQPQEAEVARLSDDGGGAAPGASTPRAGKRAAQPESHKHR
jgi:DNA-binding MarR family transcriptional regulator